MLCHMLQVCCYNRGSWAIKAMVSSLYHCCWRGLLLQVLLVLVLLVVLLVVLLLLDLPLPGLHCVCLALTARAPAA